MEIQKTQRLAEIEAELIQEDNNKGYDQRKKCHKDACQKIEVLKKEAKTMIIKQAEEYLKNLGYVFQDGKYQIEGATIYISASVYVGRDVDFNCYLTEDSNVFVNMEKTDDEIRQAIEKSMAEQLERYTRMNKRYKNFRELKNKLSEISYSNNYGNKEEGTEINIDLVGKNDWDEKSSIKLFCDTDKTTVRIDIATEIADKEKVVSMVDAIKQIIATYTDQKFVNRS